MDEIVSPKVMALKETDDIKTAEQAEELTAWITKNVRKQSGLRTRINAYEMKRLVSFELKRPVSEEELTLAMVALGYTHIDGVFNSILVDRKFKEQHRQLAKLWGFTKQSITKFNRENKCEPSESVTQLE